MDSDDARPKSAKSVVVGEPLHELSLAELAERIAALKTEIARVEAELRAKEEQGAAAAELFKQ